MTLTDIELDQAPKFELEQKVRLLRMVRNDGTYPGEDKGAPLAQKGETGYVISIGTYLQRSYIYSVHFLETNRVIGCLGKELEAVEEDFTANLLNSDS
ncbi:MAG: nitrogen fixation protein NifZ [Spirulinaceae cyanobacterium RM2_2_10]|nr:nitrogen fixation protein NifZ [Spirulinaceae cyanobacterium SM2_1_0]NJO18808.1 nitrogen fixation protein NifZ [Spirulinaceae cyanobacterium RM2_2_10]